MKNSEAAYWNSSTEMMIIFDLFSYMGCCDAASASDGEMLPPLWRESSPKIDST